MGLCPEADAFWEHLTGLQFVTTLLRFTGYDEAECRQRAENALHQVALLDAKDRKIGGYSKGMRQRVKLAQAIAHDPEVLLLDEPVSGMDPVNRRRVIDLVRKLGREGKTVRGLEPHPVRGRGHDEAGDARPQRAHPRRGRRARDPRPARRAPAHGGAAGPRARAGWPPPSWAGRTCSR